MNDVLDRTGGRMRLWPAMLYRNLARLVSDELVTEIDPPVDADPAEDVPGSIASPPSGGVPALRKRRGWPALSTSRGARKSSRPEPCPEPRLRRIAPFCICCRQLMALIKCALCYLSQYRP